MSNIFITNETPNAVHLKADNSDAGPLTGQTMAVKDLIDVAGYPTTFGSKDFSEEPVQESAAVVKTLVEAGAQIIGKTNLDEFAWGVTGQNPHWGTIQNPKAPGKVAGGSSGGTAAAIAGGYATMGLGTDTAGSVRIPAACCDIYALRPRTGQISQKGVQALAPSFDVVGPMASTLKDLIAIWEVLSGESVAQPAEHTQLRIGIMEKHIQPENTDQRYNCIEIDTPREILDPFWTVMRYEAYKTHKERFQHRKEKLGPALVRKLQVAQKISTQEAEEARERLTLERKKFQETFAEFDVMLLPSIGCEIPDTNVNEEDIREQLGWPAALISALDLPGVAIGNTQIVAATETLALNIAAQLEIHTKTKTMTENQ